MAALLLRYLVLGFTIVGKCTLYALKTREKKMCPLLGDKLVFTFVAIVILFVSLLLIVLLKLLSLKWQILSTMNCYSPSTLTPPFLKKKKFHNFPENR